jgi:predicted Zn-dependent peptidase
MEGVSSAAIGIWINTGSRNEERSINGISHFLEHLVFKGSQQFTSAQIKETIEGVGGSLNAFTSEENTCYYAKFPSRHYKKIFRTLADMVLHPLLTPRDIEKERTVIIEEIKMYKDLPQALVGEVFDALMWPNHPLGRNIAGTVDIISGITPDQIKEYHRQWYTAGSIVIACAGDTDPDTLETDTERLFHRLDYAPSKPIQPAQSRASDGARIAIHAKDIQQTHIHLGFPGYQRSHKDRFVLGVMSVILGGNMSSRLFNEIREKKGLAYEIASHVKRLKDTGVFYVHAGIDNRNLLETTRLILKELVTIKRQSVPADELKRAKDFFMGQSEMALDDTMEHMLWIGDSLTNLNDVVTKEEIHRQIKRIGVDDVRRVACDILRGERLCYAAVGPQEQTQEKKIQQVIDEVKL